MNIKELREYLNSLSPELDDCKVVLQTVRKNKKYKDIEILPLEQTIAQLMEYGLVFEVDNMNIDELLIWSNLDTMIDIENYKL